MMPRSPYLPATQSHDLSPAARQAVAAGIPASTQRAYRENLSRFLEWCEATGRSGLPATGTDLAEYATYTAYERGWAPVSIERARWAILRWHSLAELPPPSTEGLVSVLKGYRDKLAQAESPKAAPRKATAASRDTLSLMLATLDTTVPSGCRNAAILLLGFGIAARRSEIASLNIGGIEFATKGMQVTVYRQKVRKQQKPVIHYQETAALCPVRATAAWVEMLRHYGRTSGPLFVRINQHEQLARPLTRHGVPIGDPEGRMTGQAIADVIRRCALKAGLAGRWTGHALRRGFATEAHEAGHERRYIEKQGGWTAGSKAVAGYIEDADAWLVDVLEGVL